MKKTSLLSLSKLLLPVAVAAAACSSGTDEGAPAPQPGHAEAEEQGGLVLGDERGSSHATRITTSRFDDQHDDAFAALLQQKRAHEPALAAPARVVPEATVTVTEASKLAPDAPFSLVLALEEPAFDLKRLRTEDADARAKIVAERRAQLAPAQQAVIAKLEALGARDVSGFFLQNHVAATLDARHVATVAAWPEVRDLARGRIPVEPSAYSGLETRNGINHATMIANGVDGRAGSRSGGAIRIGVVDAGALVANHVGFGPGRVVRNLDCRSSTCVPAVAGTTVNHGSAVMSVATGSIEAGQDPAITTTSARVSRSGAAPRSNIYYYNIEGGGSDGVKRGFDQAVADGVDVVNYSGSFGGMECNNSGDASLMNATIRAATDAGTLVVVAAGNHDPALGTVCVGYPALRPEVLAVGALATGDAATPYLSTVVDGYSNTGPVPVRTFGGTTSTMAGVGIAAPGTYELLDYSGAASYGTTSPFAGTSFAAPTVAGLSGLLRQGYNQVGFPGNDARMLLASMFLLGDASDGVAGVTRTVGGSPRAGGGRARMHWPSSASLTGPWGWGWHTKVLRHHETWTLPIGGGPLGGVRQWKGVVLWTETDLNNVADIDFSVYDKGTDCKATPTLVASQTDYDLRNKIQLRDAQVAGRCLEMRIYGYNVPAEGRTIYTTDYFHGGTPDLARAPIRLKPVRGARRPGEARVPTTRQGSARTGAISRDRCRSCGSLDPGMNQTDLLLVVLRAHPQIGAGALDDHIPVGFVRLAPHHQRLAPAIRGLKLARATIDPRCVLERLGRERTRRMRDDRKAGGPKRLARETLQSAALARASQGALVFLLPLGTPRDARDRQRGNGRREGQRCHPRPRRRGGRQGRRPVRAPRSCGGWMVIRHRPERPPLRDR